MEPEPHQQHRPHHAQDSLEASEFGARAASIISSQLSALSDAKPAWPGSLFHGSCGLYIFGYSA